MPDFNSTPSSSSGASHVRALADHVGWRCGADDVRPDAAASLAVLGHFVADLAECLLKASRQSCAAAMPPALKSAIIAFASDMRTAARTRDSLAMLALATRLGAACRAGDPWAKECAMVADATQHGIERPDRSTGLVKAAEGLAKLETAWLAGDWQDEDGAFRASWIRARLDVASEQVSRHSAGFESGIIGLEGERLEVNGYEVDMLQRPDRKWCYRFPEAGLAAALWTGDFTSRDEAIREVAVRTALPRLTPAQEARGRRQGWINLRDGVPMIMHVSQVNGLLCQSRYLVEAAAQAA